MTLNPYMSCKPKRQVVKLRHQQKTLYANTGVYLLSLLLILLSPKQTNAQFLNIDGSTHFVSFTGSFQDFIVPDNPSITKIEFRAKGADGGSIKLDGNISDGCEAAGGAGATARGTFRIGNGINEIPRGSIVRFIVGQSTGAYVRDQNFVSIIQGGGGGTGILYKSPNSSNWEILVIAR
ncbi:MAG: hypothetical protein SFU99_17360 [Saprospiraceae bacterium]|nr:hypothetical protein [Saprospiraceae bacterium]